MTDRPSPPPQTRTHTPGCGWWIKQKYPQTIFGVKVEVELSNILTDIYYLDVM